MLSTTLCVSPFRTVAVLAALLGSAPLTAQNLGIALVNGVDGYLEIPYAPAVVPQSGITFEAWITYDDTTLGTGWRYPTLCRQNITPQQEAYFLRINANNNNARTLTWKVVTSNGVAYNCNWTFASGQLNTWTHVAGSYDGTTVALYVNGAQVSSVAANGLPIFDRGGVLRIGKGDDSGGPIEVWNGAIDEVRLWPFGRSAAEIQQSMQQQLAGVPGRVSTWNLDGHTIDTSGNLQATLVGSVAFAPNPLTLAGLAAPVGLPVGASTPGCFGPLALTVGSVARVGNAAFAAVCTRAPAGAGALFAVAFGTAPAPVSIAGIQYFLDLGTTTATFTTVGPLGRARFGIGLPTWLQPGLTLAFQYGFIDPCGPQGLTASDALVVVTQ
jgi:hypothetical protein